MTEPEQGGRFRDEKELIKLVLLSTPGGVATVIGAAADVAMRRAETFEDAFRVYLFWLVTSTGLATMSAIVMVVLIVIKGPRIPILASLLGTVVASWPFWFFWVRALGPF